MAERLVHAKNETNNLPSLQERVFDYLETAKAALFVLPPPPRAHLPRNGSI